MLLVNGTPYLVLILGDLPAGDGPLVVRGYRLTKSSGEVCDLPHDLGSCDCADGTFRAERPGGCKHAVALRLALTRIGYDVPEPKPQPAYRSTADLARNDPETYQRLMAECA